MQQLVSGISKKTVLEYAIVADAVTDPQLLEKCMQFILKTENRYNMAAVKCVESRLSFGTVRQDLVQYDRFAVAYMLTR